MAGLGAGVVAHVAHRVLMTTVTSPRWRRTNHAGAPVTLLEGPAYVAGAVVGAGVAGPAGVVGALGAGAFGALDDLAGSGASKGLRGHLGAAARGEVTTGLVKVVGIGATGLASAALADRDRPELRALDTLMGGAVVAGAANLVNLLDLRPGRALKATVAASVPLVLAAGRPEGTRAAAAAAAAAGAALGVLRADLAGTAMLGDTGANAAGALVGTALLGRTGWRGRLVTLTVLTALTLASEKVSFTRIIESTPGLRELDAWGRPTR
jgi:UDP-N-acetylmuramyl pentapeptide phosphotransferase/UDP-N-acetylglucosamine-1-phosphate transferase